MRSTLIIKHNNSIRILTITKLLIAFYLIYMYWFQHAFTPIPYALQIILLCIVIVELRYYYGKPLNLSNMPRAFLWWILYGGFSLITGILIADNQELFLHQLFLFFCYILITVIIALVSIENDDITWILYIFIIIAFLNCISVLFFGNDRTDYYNQELYRASFGNTTNTNTIGLTCFLGVFSVLMIEKRHVVQTVIAIILVFLFAYIMIASGSRKAMIATAILLLGWILFIAWRQTKKMSTLSVFGSFVVFISSCIVAIYYFMTHFSSSVGYSRLSTISDQAVRLQLYSEAFQLFKNNPIVGIGFNQFRAVSSYHIYSHSTYAETLACTGIIGFVLFFIPVLWCFIVIGKRLLSHETNNQFVLWTLMFISCLFLGIGNIWQYELNMIIIFGMIFLQFKNNRYISISNER